MQRIAWMLLASLLTVTLGAIGVDASRRESFQSGQVQRSLENRVTPEDFAICGVKLGDSPDQVKKAIGVPDESTVLHGLGLPLWRYKDRDLEIGFGVSNGQSDGVVWINGGQDFKGRTVRGVGIGTPAEKVQQVYGTNQVTRGNDSITFIIDGGKVTRILIKRGLQ